MLRNSILMGGENEKPTISISIMFFKEAICLFVYFNGALFSTSIGSDLIKGKIFCHVGLFTVSHFNTSGSHVFKEKGVHEPLL